MEQKKFAHLVGNGPSKKEFTEGWHHLADGDLYACNLPDDGPRTYKATFIMDRNVLEFIRDNKLKFKVPIIIPRAIIPSLVECDPQPEVYAYLSKEIQNGESTGHHAVMWLLDQGYTEIHLWGFDSLYKETVESDSQIKMPNSISNPNNWTRWRELWKKIFTSAEGKCKFVIHLDHTTAKSL
jgi:hypothetical protein